MLVKDAIERDKIIKAQIDYFSQNGITNFGEWLNHYASTIQEVENFVNEYALKVHENRLDEIEKWMKVIMINALALYAMEFDIDDYDFSDQIVNKVLKVYILTIRDYNDMLKGKKKLIGSIYISDISLYKFVDNDVSQNKERINH